MKNTTLNVFIIGTNCVGKTTLAKQLIEYHGGIKEENAEYTTTEDGSVFLGKYAGKKYGGVDGLNQTKGIKEIIEKARLKGASIIYAEGVRLGTFSNESVEQILSSDNSIVVFLYCPVEVIKKRLKERSGTEITMEVIKTQQYKYRTALKYKEIGIQVLAFDTSKETTEEIVKKLIAKEYEILHEPEVEQ